jgi:ubiquinone/menaquinone biosynthesis C-methylase UbiE
MRKLTDININTPEYWDAVYSNEIAMSRERIALERFQRVSAMILPNSTVLDVGCGTGDFVRYLEEHRPDCEISACDFSTAAIQHAASKSPNISFAVVDILNLSEYYSNKFDFVICFETIEHITEPQKLIDEMTSITKQNGIMIITTPYDNNVDGAGEHIHAFKFDDFLNFFNTEKSFIIAICRYSENYKNMLCTVKVL